MTAEAEVLRLTEEMRKMAVRNAWKGVMRTFRKLEGVKGAELSADNYLLGAQAYATVGDTQNQKECLTKVLALDSSCIEAQQELDSLATGYANLHITSKKKQPAKAELVTAPFHPGQRKSLEYMVAQVNETGNFHGMVPSGPLAVFKINGEEMSLETGTTTNWSAKKGKDAGKKGTEEPPPAAPAAEEAPKVNDRAREKAYADMDQALEWNTPSAVIYQYKQLKGLGVDIPDHYQQAYEKAKAGQALGGDE